MIGERALGIRRQESLRGKGEALRRQITSQSAVAGREWLLTAIEASVLARIITAMGLFAVAILLYAAQAGQVSVHEFNIADLRAEQGQLAMQNAALHAQATGLQSPQRIAQIASTQLHMSAPDALQAIWVRPVFPTVTPLPRLDADTQLAAQQSQPLAWLTRLSHYIQSSL